MSNMSNLECYQFKHLLLHKGWLDLPSSGVSMYPLIREGDICRFVSLTHLGDIKRGDILLFISNHGKLVGHRCIGRDGEFYICKGDTNVCHDPMFTVEELIGKLLWIQKKRYILTADSILFRIWSFVVSVCPTVPIYCKRYYNFKKRCTSFWKNRRLY